ncbi:TetR/AcrR family transcriptional regulator C-terminal ligand-binding domain-containing protein [Streptomyces laculatispora]|uniref:TetR/AcrR family transcriptional regulator C-terminal ligand-binding domain-containing protein n=1 Tax=Streptomyces laculatispora TaxID=887464 RepID=A0ABY9I470_9ACTN|nr:TetR/AcrR family transcriptional regulator C-terminal ligand-binding domain-containing protein [Streptomyces laculatispora]WLQ41660.1 TetR/AcrR family transcriptional regulator C-terminal ligand-binding domain-containing protein [Streptomyces laculatispora]
MDRKSPRQLVSSVRPLAIRADQRGNGPRGGQQGEHLRRGIRRGDIRADVDIDLLLDLLASTTYCRVLFGHLPVTSSLAEQVVQVVLAGVATEQWRSQHEGPDQV